MTDPGSSMRADMAEQPEVLRGFLDRRPDCLARLRGLTGQSPVGTIIVARGSSDYAAVYGRYLIESTSRRPVALAAPSLFTLYGVETDLSGWLAIGVSQSGQTPEIATVLEQYARAGARTIAVTNDPASAVASVAAAHVDLGAGEERAVPATKTFTAQLAAFALIAEALGPVRWTGADWEALPLTVDDVLRDPAPAEEIARALSDDDELICLARGYLLCVAFEAALKLREAAGVRAEGWSAADFRHGPVTVARGDLPVLTVSAGGPAAADVADLAQRLERSGTRVARIGDTTAADLAFPSRLPEPLAALPATVRAQQLALASALVRGANPDEPPGLKKVTPTE